MSVSRRTQTLMKLNWKVEERLLVCRRRKSVLFLFWVRAHLEIRVAWGAFGWWWDLMLARAPTSNYANADDAVGVRALRCL
jgi:hypothetical protein